MAAEPGQTEEDPFWQAQLTGHELRALDELMPDREDEAVLEEWWQPSEVRLHTFDLPGACAAGQGPTPRLGLHLNRPASMLLSRSTTNHTGWHHNLPTRGPAQPDPGR